jgi:GGDEF domain-containing protein
VGFSVYPRDGDTLEMLLKKADKAMYNAKKSGKNRWMICPDE